VFGARANACAAFRAALIDERTRAAAAALTDDALAERLQAFIEAAARDWDRFRVSPEVFAAHVARVLASTDEPLLELQSLHGGDLYLAAACGEHEVEAIRAFESRYAIEVDTALARFRGAIAEEDFRQVLRDKLFVGTAEHPPGILQYAGRGDLRYWVRMTVVRALTDQMRRREVRKREVSVQDDTIDALLAPTLDTELEYLKGIYRAEFRAALAESLAELETRERNLLRYSVAEQLGIDQIGAIYCVHRSTAARWLARARERLIDGVTERLRSRLRVDPAELQSILRMISSRVDVGAEIFES
jgi:RNA polymerase sigma-70 factor (ECF subfamily)